MALRDFEREYLRHAIASANGKRVCAAATLGTSRKCLWGKLRLHGISGAELENGAPTELRPGT